MSRLFAEHNWKISWYARQMTHYNCTICAGAHSMRRTHTHTGSLRDIGFLAIHVSFYTYNNNIIIKIKSTQARCDRFVRISDTMYFYFIISDGYIYVCVMCFFLFRWCS